MSKIFALFLVVFVWVIIPLMCAFGWVMNIVKLIGTHGEHGVLFIDRCFGIIVPPLGVVLGFVN